MNNSASSKKERKWGSKPREIVGSLEKAVNTVKFPNSDRVQKYGHQPQRNQEGWGQRRKDRVTE